MRIIDRTALLGFLRLITFVAVLFLLVRVLGTLVRAGLSYHTATLTVSGVVTVLCALLMVIAMRTSPYQRGVIGFVLGRARRVVTGTIRRDWIVLVFFSLGTRLLSPRDPDIGLLIGAGWLLNWFVLFPTKRDQAQKASAVAADMASA